MNVANAIQVLLFVSSLTVLTLMCAGLAWLVGGAL